MLLRLSTIVITLVLLGCQKQYHKPNNSDVSVVEDLNSSNYEKVISELQARPSLSPRENYYLASAFSQAGGVDIFSLYAVMEIEIFHESALKWSDLSKDKNPYLKFMKSQEGVDDDVRKKKREAKWIRYEKQIRNKYDLNTPKPSIEDLNKYADDERREKFTPTKYEELIKICEEKKVEIMNSTADISSKEFFRLFWPVFDEWDKRHPNSIGPSYQMLDYYSQQTRYEMIKRDYIYPESRKTDFAKGSQNWEMIYMNVLWNTYAAIPVMKKLPTFTDVQQDKISQALDAYFNLLHEKEFKDVAIKNILILSSVSLLGLYKGSFDFEEVKDVQDLMCSFDPTVLLDRYSFVRKRLLFLAKVIKEMKEDIKDYEKYKINIDSLELLVPEKLTDDEKQVFQDDIDQFKVNNCFNS